MARRRGQPERTHADLLLGALQVAAQRSLLPAEAWACSRTLFAVAVEHAPVWLHLYGDGRPENRSFLNSTVVSSAPPPGVVSRLLRRKVVGLVAEGRFAFEESSSCVVMPSTIQWLHLANMAGGIATIPLPQGLTSLTVQILKVNGSDGGDADDIWHARLAALIAAVPPTLASLDLDCYNLQSLPHPLQMPPRLRELTLLRRSWETRDYSQPISDTILPSSLDTLTLEEFTVVSDLKLPINLRTLRLAGCTLKWPVVTSGRGGGGGGTGANDSSTTQFPLFPESLITLELESLYFAIECDCDPQPALMLPPRIKHLRVTSEDANRDYVTFDGSLGPLPPSLRTLFVDHYEAAELPPLPPGLRELTLGEYDHALQAPLPPCLEALELRDWCTPQRVCDALATAIGGNLQRLTLAGPIPGGSLRLAIGPLPTTLTHFTCWLWGHKNEEGSSSDAQLPPLPQGLQELRVNGVSLPAALPASLRLLRHGMDVDMSALEEPLSAPGRHVEVAYRARDE